MTVSNLAYLFTGRKFASFGVNVARPFVRESLSLLFCLFLLCDVTQADAWRTLAKTVSKAAGLAEDVPLRKLDNLKGVGKRDELVREAIERKLGRKIVGTADEVQHLARQLDEILGSANRSLVDEVRRLPLPEQRLALTMASGAKRFEEVVGDIATRARLIRDLGPESLITVGRYPDLAEDAFRFQTAVRTGKLVSPPGFARLEPANFGRFFEKTGEAGYQFWTKYVRRKWVLWVAAGGALAAVMLMPEEYLNQAGDFTREGIAKIARFATKELLSVIQGTTEGVVEGVGEGTKGLIKGVAEEIVETFFTSIWGVLALLAIVVIIICVVRPVRVALFKLAAWLFSLRRLTGVGTSSQEGAR